MTEERCLKSEARLLCHRLADIDADDALVAHYVAAHESRAELLESTDLNEAFLVRLACSGPIGFRLADGFSGLFRRESLLRRKLVLVTALLECDGSTWRKVDRARSSNFLTFVIAVGAGAVCDIFCAVVATPFVLLKLWPERSDMP